jgi:NADP oxidoreductase coenzyme F420-dependent
MPWGDPPAMAWHRMRPASRWLLAGMKIAVIGKGNIGGTLGSKWRAAGHDVVYGARDGSGQGPGGAPVRSIGDALEAAEVLLLAVPSQAVPLGLTPLARRPFCAHALPNRHVSQVRGTAALRRADYPLCTASSAAGPPRLPCLTARHLASGQSDVGHLA